MEGLRIVTAARPPLPRSPKKKVPGKPPISPGSPSSATRIVKKLMGTKQAPSTKLPKAQVNVTPSSLASNGLTPFAATVPPRCGQVSLSVRTSAMLFANSLTKPRYVTNPHPTNLVKASSFAGKKESNSEASDGRITFAQRWGMSTAWDRSRKLLRSSIHCTLRLSCRAPQHDETRTWEAVKPSTAQRSSIEPLGEAVSMAIDEDAPMVCIVPSFIERTGSNASHEGMASFAKESRIKSATLKTLGRGLTRFAAIMPPRCAQVSGSTYSSATALPRSSSKLQPRANHSSVSVGEMTDLDDSMCLHANEIPVVKKVVPHRTSQTPYSRAKVEVISVKRASPDSHISSESQAIEAAGTFAATREGPRPCLGLGEMADGDMSDRMTSETSNSARHGDDTPTLSAMSSRPRKRRFESVIEDAPKKRCCRASHTAKNDGDNLRTVVLVPQVSGRGRKRCHDFSCQSAGKKARTSFPSFLVNRALVGAMNVC